MRTKPVDTKAESKHPLLVQTDPVDGLRIRCNEHSNIRNCSVYYKVAQGIWTQIQLNSIRPGEEEMTVHETLGIVENIWTQMTLDRN